MATAFNSPKRSGMAPMPEPGPALAPLALGGGALSRRGPAAPSAATHPEVPPLNLNNAPSATDLVDAEESESWLEPMRYRLCRYRWRGGGGAHSQQGSESAGMGAVQLPRRVQPAGRLICGPMRRCTDPSWQLRHPAMLRVPPAGACILSPLSMPC